MELLVLVLCILFHRFYMRYVTYYIYCWVNSHEGSPEQEFMETSKENGFTGHKFRVALWAGHRRMEGSRGNYLINTTFAPIIYGIIYYIILYYAYTSIFG